MGQIQVVQNLHRDLHVILPCHAATQSESHGTPPAPRNITMHRRRRGNFERTAQWLKRWLSLISCVMYATTLVSSRHRSLAGKHRVKLKSGKTTECGLKLTLFHCFPCSAKPRHLTMLATARLPSLLTIHRCSIDGFCGSDASMFTTALHAIDPAQIRKRVMRNSVLQQGLSLRQKLHRVEQRSTAATALEAREPGHSELLQLGSGLEILGQQQVAQHFLAKSFLDQPRNCARRSRNAVDGAHRLRARAYAFTL